MTFTGSTETGRRIMESAAPTLKRLTLELGGNDAGIVLPDADPKAIAEGLFWGAFINTGQTCACLKRLYVHDSIYDDVCRELTDYASDVPVGDGLLEASRLARYRTRCSSTWFPHTSRTPAPKVDEYCSAATDGGPGYFYPVTLVADVDHGCRLVDEEQFGPALPIIRYRDVDEVVAKANDNPTGLGGSVWGSDLDQAKAVASQLECGSVWINKHGAIQPNAPFGGVKQSGIGVEFGAEGLKEFTTVQTVFC